MDQKTEIMIALGTAVGVNCIPCFDHLYSRAKAVEMADAEIKQVVQIAQKVKNGASMFLKQAISEVVGEVGETGAACCSLPGCTGTESKCA